MTRSGYRTCQRCGQSRAVRFFKPRGKICSQCQRKRTSATTKDQRLRDTYGITLAEWDALLQQQQGCCAICKGRRQTYDVDHDHKLEKLLLDSGIEPTTAARMSVRGLLCKRCNRRLLPAATDKTSVLESAIQYLDSPPAQALLTGTVE